MPTVKRPKEAEAWFVAGNVKQGKSHLARWLVEPWRHVLVYDAGATIWGRPQGRGRREKFRGLVTSDLNEFAAYVRKQMKAKQGFRVGYVDLGATNFEKWLSVVNVTRSTENPDERPEFPVMVWVEEAAIPMPRELRPPKAYTDLVRLRQHNRTAHLVTTQQPADVGLVARGMFDVRVSLTLNDAAHLRYQKEQGFPPEALAQIPKLKRGEFIVLRDGEITRHAPVTADA